MTNTITKPQWFRRQIALPQDHGSWVFLLSPLAIGLFAGGAWLPETGFLILAAFAAFLIRQPVTMAVKATSGRRPKSELPAAIFWIGIYALVGLAAFFGLAVTGHAYLAILALPGLPVFAIHLGLVSRRAERKQLGVELVGSGVLALAAPAAFWLARGYPDPMGWWLFGLSWFQSAASIVYAYLRLAQRALPGRPATQALWRMGSRALAYTSFNLAVVLAFSLTGSLPPLLPLPFALQWGETLWGITHPAIGWKPTRIGFRQLTVSILFTILFILTW